MKLPQMRSTPLAAAAFVYACAGVLLATALGAAPMTPEERSAWQSQVVESARIMAEVQWTPVAEGMPGHPRRTDRDFQPGVTYTGVPYSNGGSDGRYIGFDVSLRTFLAAIENPHSVLYTRDVRKQAHNAAAYYGMVCSTFTSYALQSPIRYVSSAHLPVRREGIIAVEPNDAQAAEVGDVIHLPGHVVMVTGVTRDARGRVTHVLTQESTPPRARTTQRTAREFDAYLEAKKGTLNRITDRVAFGGGGRLGETLFPNHALDAVPPVINRVLLLDHGDWVPYRIGDTVAFNIMDRDGQGVRSLVIRRAGEEVETIAVDGPGIIERTFTVSGDYTAHCVMADGSPSQACEFAVCSIEARPVKAQVGLDEPWSITFKAENMKVLLVQVRPAASEDNPEATLVYLWLTDEDRARGIVEVPAGIFDRERRYTFWVEGEHRYGRLRTRNQIQVTASRSSGG